MTEKQLELFLTDEGKQRDFLRFCYALNRDSYMDLYQHSMMQAVQHVSRIKDLRHFGNWLRTVARNRAIDDSRRPPEISMPTEDATSSNEMPDIQFLNTVEAERIRAAVNCLPDAQRAVVLMAFFEQMPLRDIASALDISYAATNMRLHHAIEKIRATLSPRIEITKPRHHCSLSATERRLNVCGEVQGDYSESFKLFLMFRCFCEGYSGGTGSYCWTRAVGPVVVDENGHFEEWVELPSEVFRCKKQSELHGILAVRPACEKLATRQWPTKDLPSGTVDSTHVTLGLEPHSANFG